MDELDTFLNQVRAIALRDNMITREEEDLIEAVAEFVGEYRKFMAEASSQNGTRQKNLLVMKKTLLDHSWEISKRDHRISNEESDIITLIYNFLKNLHV